MKDSSSSCFLVLFIFFSVSSAGAGTLAESYTALAIQGDLQQARILFEQREGDLSPADRELVALFQARFIERSESTQNPSGNALVDEITAVYRTYWADSLLFGTANVDPTAPAEALGETLSKHGWAATLDAPVDAMDIFEKVEAALAAQGVHALAVQASPLQDLLVWASQSEAEFEVELTDHSRRVRVVFLSDFYSQGWKHFATLGFASTTGWVEDGALYCVEWAYAPETEAFEVSYLKHESRHLADFERFAGLSSTDLEYRAKMTELAFANRTLRQLLEDFTIKSAANPESPHAQANYRVTRDVWHALYDKDFPGGDQAWMTLNRTKVNHAARRLLAQDTARLTALTQANSDDNR